MNRQDIPDDDPIHDLSGVRLRIFCYLLQENKATGVRDTQRALGLKTASHASYHLQKLVDDGIVEKNAQNAYYLLDRYKTNSIQVNVLTEYYLLAGRFWPRTVFFSVYLFISIIISLILIGMSLYTILVFYLSISLVVSFAIAVYEVVNQMRALPWEATNS